MAPVGDLDKSSLIRLIRNVFEQEPPRTPSALAVEELVVNRLLIVNDEVRFAKKPNFERVGGTGSAGFLNSWDDFGSPYLSVAYWLDPLGFTHLRGVVTAGTVGSPAFRLPPGLRPPATAGPFAVVSNDVFGQVEVDSDGNVTPLAPSNNASVSLFGISFKV